MNKQSALSNQPARLDRNGRKETQSEDQMLSIPNSFAMLASFAVTRQ
jgi:hypothetical protein